MPRPMLALLVGSLLSSGAIAAAEGPVPPCGEPAFPAPTRLGAPPAVRVWTEGDLGGRWTPPPCSRWTAPGFRTLVAVAGSFRQPGGAEALLARFGAVSQAVGIRYWSVTGKNWRQLVLDAHAVDAPETGRPRADFSPAEMASGRDLAFSQTDNVAGQALYRLRVLAAGPARLALETENASPVRRFLVPLFGPGDLQTLYVLDRQAADVWTYYSLTRTGRRASALTAGHEASAINRAIAVYRHVAGVATDREPPAAP